MTPDSPQVELAQAVRRQMDQADQSADVDRTGWTHDQWVADARTRFNHIDGAVTSLVNGHIEALLDEIDQLQEALDLVEEELEQERSG